MKKQDNQDIQDEEKIKNFGIRSFFILDILVILLFFLFSSKPHSAPPVILL